MTKEIRSKSVPSVSWVTIGRPAIAEIMADAGFEWLAVDLEHSAFTTKETRYISREHRSLHVLVGLRRLQG